MSTVERQSWTLWYDEFPADNMDAETFFERCVRFKDVKTPEEFRSAWRTLSDGEKTIPLNSNLRVFRRDIRPIIPDARNTRGGKFVLTFDDDEYVDIWHSLASAILSEELTPANFMTGFVLNMRPNDATISVWVGNASADDDIHYMKCQLRLLLNIRKLMFVRHGEVRAGTPFEQADPIWAKKVDEYQELEAPPRIGSSSHRRSSPAARLAAPSGPRSCRTKLTSLEDPFLCSPTPKPELMHADSDITSSGSDDSVDRSLKYIGLSPIMNRHGRQRRNRVPRKGKQLGASEYEQALDILGQANHARHHQLPVHHAGILMAVVTAWTHFWMTVTGSFLGGSQTALDSWDQRLSLLCYGVCYTIWTALQKLGGRMPAGLERSSESPLAPRAVD